MKSFLDDIQQKFPIGQHVAIGDENYEHGWNYHRCKVVGLNIDDYKSTIDVLCPFNRKKTFSIYDTRSKDGVSLPLLRPRKKERVNLDDIQFQYTGHYLSQDEQGKEYLETFHEVFYNNDDKNEKYKFSDLSIEEEEKLLKHVTTQKELEDILDMGKENFDHLDFATDELEKKWLDFYEKEGDEGVYRLKFKTRGVKPEFDYPHYMFRFYLQQ